MTSQNTERKQSESSAGNNVIIHEYPSIVEWISKIFVFLSEDTWAKWTAAGLLVITFFLTFPNYGDDYDIWFHLAYGKHYVTQMTWHIDQAQFSWTPVDVTTWIYGTWLGSALMYVFYWIGGIPAIYAMQWMVLISVLAMMTRYAGLLKDRLDMFRVMGLMLVIIVLKLTQVYLKPQMLSTCLFSVTVFIYYSTIQLQHQKSRLYYFYPLIFMLWVNVHGEFMVGLAFLGIAWTGELIAAAAGKNWVRLKQVVVPFGVSIALSWMAILINPDGISYPASILKIWLTQRNAVSEANVSAQSMWNSIGFHMQNYNFVNAADAMVLMALIYVFFCLAGLRKTRRINIPILLIHAAFFYMSMKMARATLFFPIVWFYGMYTLISESGLGELKRKLSPFFMAIFAFLSFYTMYMLLITMPYATWFGYHFDNFIPKKEVEYINKFHLQGPIFNDYLLGGYMMWAMYPEYKVWIDPRSGPYIKEVLPDWLRITSNLSDDSRKYLLSKYPFKTALIGMWRSDLIFWLMKSPEWRLAYFDKCAAVIINTSLIPTLPPEALATEVGTNRFLDIDNPTILNNLFSFYLAVGPIYATDIRNIFERNVSDWLHGKKEILANMDEAIRKKEAVIQSMAAQQQAAASNGMSRNQEMDNGANQSKPEIVRPSKESKPARPSK